MLEKLKARLAAIAAEIRAINDLAAKEERTALTVEEDTKYTELRDERTALEARVAQLEDEETRRKADADAQKRLGVKLGPDGLPRASIEREPLTYSRLSALEDRTSYFKDLATLAVRGNGMDDAQKRLNRHGAEMDVEMPARAQRRDDNAEKEVRNQVGWDAPNIFEKRVNPNRTDGQGGYLVPPVWLMDELIPILRAGRVIADQCNGQDLPAGTDSINLPKLATGTSTAIQTADAQSVSSTDFTDTSVSAGVKTIAGQEDISIQLLEQSPLSLDSVIFSDLIADYNKKLDLQVLAGTNANGQVQGLYSSAGASSWTNYNQVTYTDASPTAPELFSPLAVALSQIEQNRFDLEGVKFFMHSRRWFWMAAAVDGNSRPIVLPSSFPGFNPLAVAGATAVPPGYKGQLALGFPVFTDPLVTTTDTAGGGTLQDIIIALKTPDAFLFEGELRQRTLPEVLSGTLQVRFQVYNYVAFLLRYAQSLAIISGSGMAAPSGF